MDMAKYPGSLFRKGRVIFGAELIDRDYALLMNFAVCSRLRRVEQGRNAAADPQVHDAIPEITRPAVCHDRKPSGSRNDGLNGWRNSRCNGRQNGGRNGRPCKNKNHNSL